LVGLDERDLEILRILSDDARVPWRRLAHMLGVSEATVYLRVKRLIEERVIRGFTVDVDVEKVGLRVSAFVLVRVEASGLRQFRSFLANFPYVVEAYEISGDFQFLAKIIAPSQQDLAWVIDSLAEAPGAKDVKVLIVLRKLKDGVGVVESLKIWWDRLKGERASP